jgi:small subunit ribosomal protein S14
MAKKSKIARNEQRKVIVERYASKRLELKKTLVDPNATDEAREAARLGLQKLPRDASPIRLRNRDIIDGRPRGTFQKFGISRVRFRDMAHRGELPGITKRDSAKPGGVAVVGSWDRIGRAPDLPPGFTCPAVLRYLSSEAMRFRLRDHYPLRCEFPFTSTNA